MRAVNLIPEEERRGAGGTAGRSGGAAFALLGLLALLVVLVSAYALQHRTVGDKRSELATVQADAEGSEAQAASLADYTTFAALRAKRVNTVKTLAAGRFDWAHSLDEIARVVPAGVWFTSLKGTVASGVTLKSGGTGSTSSLRSAVASPAIELAGCTSKQADIARVITRMRLVDGVSRVSLQSAVKNDAATGSAAGDSPSSPGSGPCAAGAPQFALVMFFDRTASAVPTTAAGRVRASFRRPEAKP